MSAPRNTPAEPDESLDDSVADVAPSDGLSVIGSLRDRRAAIVRSQVLPLKVPRWTEPEILVRYRPVEHTLVKSVSDKVQKAPKDRQAQLEIDLNCDVLIRACDSVVALLDGNEYSLRLGDPHGAPTKFDPDLAANLGLTEESLGRRPTARDVIKALYITDADIISAAGALAEFSGYKLQEADDTFVGE